MRSYARRIVLATALALGALPRVAAAGPFVTVGIGVPLPPPVVVVRPAAPAPAYVWVDGAWVQDPSGQWVWVNGYWAAPAARTVVVSRPVVARTTVVHRAPVVVTHAHGPPSRTVVVRH